jgi:hypothetical protein
VSGFLITPFSAEAAGGEDEERFLALQACIEEAASLAEVELLKASDIFRSGVIVDQIRSAIEDAEVIVGVCTGRNANVFYELGLAEVLGHKPILIGATTADLPFDVAHWRCQMYATSEQGLDTFTERLRRAIEETMSARAADPSPSVAVATGLTAVSTANPEISAGGMPAFRPAVEIVRSGDFIGFSEQFKRLAQDVAERHESIATENSAVQPNVLTFDELRPTRYQGVQEMLEWIKPAIEYKSDWIVKVNDVVLPWFARSATGSSAGFKFWIDLHQSWVTLFIKSAIGYALDISAWESVDKLISNNSSAAPPGDPLVLSPNFVWAMGDSDVAFRDVLSFTSLDGHFEGTLENRTEKGTRVACGTDMALGLARCLYQERIGQGTEPLQTYAAFASYHCPNVRWLAQKFNRSNEAAHSIGATGADQLREVATRRWGDLIALHHPQRFQNTCATWESAVNSTDNMF